MKRRPGWPRGPGRGRASGQYASQAKWYGGRGSPRRIQMHRLLMAATLLALSGCGTPASPFVGSWTSVGSETENCTTGSNVTSLNGGLTMGQGTAAADLVTQPPNGCNLAWTVNGSTAALKGSQTCTVPGSAGGTWTATFTSGTLTLAERTIGYT